MAANELVSEEGGFMKIFEGYAPPGVWGWQTELSSIRGSKPVTVSIETVSQGKSTFDAEIEYWDGSVHKKDFLVVPGNVKFTFRPNCICTPKIRFKSHSTGQGIRVIDTEMILY